ncbi:MAG: hypothetical protein L6R41_004405 [Letrouitia leprolyta]|nr:MAG: hypothetical protein L6R41_004405 [Letrouitia leprolyta]
MSNPSPEISVLQILAKLVLEGGCEELAESLSSGVLRKSIHLHGMDHPFTLNCISSLAVVLAQRGHLSRAEALSRRALKGLEHALGNDHPDCLKTACRLADYICAQERYDDATLRHKTILKKQQMRIGKDHPDTLLTMRSLGIDFALQRSWRDSETLLDEAFDRLKVCCGPEDAQTIETADVLEYVKDMQEQKDHSRGGDNWQQDLLKIFRTRTRPMSYNTLIYANSDSSCHTSAEAELLQAVIAHDEERLAKALLENNFESAVLGRALRESAATSQEAMVRTLLSSNAPVNGQSGYHGSALQAASLAGSRAIVELLLENKADVYHEGGILGNALRAAVFGHNEAILRLLLQSIGPRKSSRDILNSSLQLALRNDDPAMIDLLLGAGADINAGDSFLGSPLQQAAFFGQENIMTRQLRSADINKRGGIFGIPLQAALETQNESVVKQLLEAGATVHSKSTNSEPKGQISTQEQEELAKIMLKRLAYSLPQRIHSVDFGLWDPMQAPKHSIIRVTRPVESHRYSRGHSPKPLPSEKPPQPKRVPTLKRLLKGGGTSEVSHANLPTRGPRARTQRSFQSVKRRVSGLK